MPKLITLEKLAETVNIIKSKLSSKSDTSHTHRYAGSETAGG